MPATVPTDADVDAFLDALPPNRRDDARTVRDLMSRVTGAPAELWGTAIVGFGRRTVTPASGRPYPWMEVAFSPRKAATVLYLEDGFDRRTDLLDRLGPHTVGRSCLNLTRVGAVDPVVLEELVTASVRQVRGG